MGTEVLRPQDCLVERLRVSPAGFHGRKHHVPNGYVKANRKPGPARSEPKKSSNNQHNSHHHHHHHHQHREPVNSKRSSAADQANGQARAVNGNRTRPVTILRRGQSLDSLTSKIKGEDKTNGGTETMPSVGEALATYGLNRLGPDKPEMLPRQINLGRPTDIYAGSGFSASPSPSSLPLPSFFKKPEFNSFDDSATRDLRRLLRLE